MSNKAGHIANDNRRSAIRRVRQCKPRASIKNRESADVDSIVGNCHLNAAPILQRLRARALQHQANANAQEIPKQQSLPSTLSHLIVNNIKNDCSLNKR